MALAMCEAGGSFTHVLVVPEFWAGMQGDDWLNNASTRDAFARHLEGELAREVDEQIARVKGLAAAAGIRGESRVAIGRPTERLLEIANEVRADLVVMGSRRPRGTPGLRSSVDLRRFQAELHAPLMVVPHHR